MKDAQKPDHPSLSTMVTRLREGRFVIPDFQRDFEWVPWDISALMRSIFRRHRIRHSRHVTETGRKDGEAALPWCRQALELGVGDTT